jgi:hypothetical protein
LLLFNCCCLNCYCPTVVVQPLLSKHWTATVQTLNCYCPTVSVQLLLFELLLSNGCCPTIAVWTLIRFLTISRVLELHFKWDWSHWKAKTRCYKFSEEREPSSASKIVKIAHQPISLTALQNQSQLSLGW